MRYRSMAAGATLILLGAAFESFAPTAAEATGAPAEKSETTAPAPVLTTAKPASPVLVEKGRWNKAEVDAALARCRILLDKLNIVAIASPPVKEGECGAPAPVQLISIGAAPQVSLSPPPLVTCELAAALAAWLDGDVQPAARAILGGPVIRLEVMSAYSCRNAYARLKARLSEHGRANALDIAKFVTERGEIAQMSDWGETGRDMRTRLAAEAEAARAAAGTGIVSAPANGPLRGEGVGLKESIAEGTGAIRPAAEPLANIGGTVPALGLAPPNRLGGPRPPKAAEVAPRQRFLRRVHGAACNYFGTVLGPEANEAHRNHFHVDMADRPVKRICE